MEEADLHSTLVLTPGFVSGWQQLTRGDHSAITNDCDRFVINAPDDWLTARWPLRRPLGRSFFPGEFGRVVLNLPRRALVVGNPDAGQIVVAVGSHHCATRESSDVRLYTEKAKR